MRIFLDSADYQKFVHLLADVVESFEIECWSYCLMPNHYHAALRPIRPNLSEAIRELNGNYGQWWNRRHGRVGHVFQGRFKDQIVQQEGYVLALFRYIARNPVRAGLKARPEDWQWSSYAATIGLRPVPPFVAAPLVLGQFGECESRIQQTRFADFVMGGEPRACPEDRIRSKERILGDKSFKETVRARAGWTTSDRTQAASDVVVSAIS